jgi:hypothetical protein
MKSRVFREVNVRGRDLSCFEIGGFVCCISSKSIRLNPPSKVLPILES